MLIPRKCVREGIALCNRSVYSGLLLPEGRYLVVLLDVVVVTVVLQLIIAEWEFDFLLAMDALT